MIKIHKLKIEERFADAVLYGDKKFEIRFNDRNYEKGDIVLFNTISDGKHYCHPLNWKSYKITYVLSGWGIKDGYVVFGICEVDRRLAIINKLAEIQYQMRRKKVSDLLNIKRQK